MGKLGKFAITKKGFTIVELLVVIAVIEIIAGIVIVSYSGWRHTTLASQVKSDLNGLSAALESSKNFNGGYPTTSGALNALFTVSTGTSLTPTSLSATAYCLDATATSDSTITYYLASESKDQGALSGTCATRPGLPAPGAPSALVFTAVGGTYVSLSWTAGTNVVTYNVQCASDAGFILGLQSTTVNSPTVTATVSNLTPSTTYYCRVDATNANGTSAWVTQNSSGTTNNSYGSLAVATSIEGYWTSAPQGFLLEDGSAVSRYTYSDLFAVIGTTYGAGDGSSTFNLPDSRGRVSVNLSPSDSEFNTIGEKYGEKAHTMTVNEMPSHTHIQNPHTHSIGFYWSGSEANPYGINLGGGFVDRVIVGNSSYPVTTVTATNQSTGSNASENVIQPSIVKVSAIKYTAATGTATNVSVGTSVAGYWSAAPSGYLAEDGSAVSRSTYASLFSMIGTTYGAGDGSTTFNLPDSRGRVSVNLNSSDAEFNTMGEKYGEKTHLMSLSEMANHTHIQNPHSTTVTLYPSGSEAAGYGASTPGQGFGGRLIVTGGGTATSATTATNQSTGGGQAFNVIQPSIVKLFVIKY